MANVLTALQNVLPINKGHTVSPQESIAAIQQVSREFEKVYTSINKLNSSVSEGVEQLSVYTVNLKKKFQELKKLLIAVCTLLYYLSITLNFALHSLRINITSFHISSGLTPLHSMFLIVPTARKRIRRCGSKEC